MSLVESMSKSIGSDASSILPLDDVTEESPTNKLPVLPVLALIEQELTLTVAPSTSAVPAVFIAF